jgi:Ulp1 family protease
LEYSSTRLPPEDVTEFSVDTDDVDGLDYGEYISGTIVEFWMKFYSDNYLTPKDQRRIAVYSDQFYIHLDKPELVPDFDENVGNIFLKDFVFAPINEEYVFFIFWPFFNLIYFFRSHWVLAVICYPALLFETDFHKDPKLIEYIQKKKSEGKSPMIIFLDSFLSYAVNHKKMVRLIRKFVKSEWTVIFFK